MLLENVMLAMELFKDYHKESDTPRNVIKFDISKAFDIVQWSFITITLRALHFPELFIHSIHLCLSMAYFSVTINGSVVSFFPSKWVLQKGALSLINIYVGDEFLILSHQMCHIIRLGWLSSAT